jgi:hypothetical protein
MREASLPRSSSAHADSKSLDALAPVQTGERGIVDINRLRVMRRHVTSPKHSHEHGL